MVCRFCKKHDDDDRLLKYGTRHYAHADCFFGSSGRPFPLDDLHDWQIRNVPYLILKKYGLLTHPRVVAITKQIDAEIAAKAEAAA